MEFIDKKLELIVSGPFTRFYDSHNSLGHEFH